MNSQISLSKIDCVHMTKLISALSTSFKKGSDELQWQLSQVFGYHSSLFWKIDQEGNLSDPTNHRISDYLVEDYLRGFHHHDYLHPKKHLHVYKKNVVLRLEDVICLKNYERSDYYKEFMKKHHFYHEMVVTFHSRNKFVGALGIARPMSEKGFTEVDRNRLRILAPVISNLLYLEREYEELRMEKEILEAFAAKNDTGFILLDQNFDVIYMNPAVWDIYRDTATHKNMDSFVKDIRSTCHHRFTNSSMLELQGYNIQVISHQEQFLSKESRYAIIIKKDKSFSAPYDKKLIYDLTKREKEVCFYMKKGFTYKEISEELFISIHTVNKHVKSIYKKIGVNSRASLQALLLQMNDETFPLQTKKG